MKIHHFSISCSLLLSNGGGHLEDQFWASSILLFNSQQEEIISFFQSTTTYSSGEWFKQDKTATTAHDSNTMKIENHLGYAAHLICHCAHRNYIDAEVDILGCRKRITGEGELTSTNDQQPADISKILSSSINLSLEKKIVFNKM